MHSISVCPAFVVIDGCMLVPVLPIIHNSLYILLLVGCRVVTSDKFVRKSFTQLPRRFGGQRPHDVFTPCGTKWSQ